MEAAIERHYAYIWRAWSIVGEARNHVLLSRSVVTTLHVAIPKANRYGNKR